MHTNFSNTDIRDKGGEDMIKGICEKFRGRHEAHIASYGSDNDQRLTGLHETQAIDQFSYGVSDRGASIRIPVGTVQNGLEGLPRRSSPCVECRSLQGCRRDPRDPSFLTGTWQTTEIHTPLGLLAKRGFLLYVGVEVSGVIGRLGGPHFRHFAKNTILLRKGEIDMSPQDVLAMCRERDVKAVDLRFMDFPGLWQHFTIPVDKLDEEVFEDGLGFDGSSIPGLASHQRERHAVGAAGGYRIPRSVH